MGRIKKQIISEWKEEKEKEEIKESWYAIYLVLGIFVFGLTSVFFGNAFFKIAGLFTIIISFIVLVEIINKFQRRFEKEWEQMMDKS